MSDFLEGGRIISHRNPKKVGRRVRRRRAPRMRMTRSLASKVRSSNSCITIRRSLMTTASMGYNGVLTNTFLAFEFTLQSIPNYTEFTALYDQYRIRKIVMTFIPRFNSFGSADSTGTFTQVPSWISAIDLDDSTVPTSVDELMQYPGARLHPWSQTFRRRIYPRPALALYGAGVFTSYGSPNNKQWVDCASANVPYYALKMASTTYSAANNGKSPSWDVKIDYTIQFRGVR